MCSTKCATPLLLAVSHLEPASIHKPTVAVCEPLSSVATRIPFSSVVTLVSGTFTWVAHEAAVDLQHLGTCATNTDTEVSNIDECHQTRVSLIAMLTWVTPDFNFSALKGVWMVNKRDAILYNKYTRISYAVDVKRCTTQGLEIGRRKIRKSLSSPKHMIINSPSLSV